MHLYLWNTEELIGEKVLVLKFFIVNKCKKKTQKEFSTY
jgi:hypothetical protein